MFPQNDPEAIFDTRVQKHPEAVFAWEARKKSNRLKSQSNQEFVRTVEEENEIEMLEAMKKMNVDDDRAEEEDMNELIDAMGRLQIHEKVKASRCKQNII